MLENDSTEWQESIDFVRDGKISEDTGEVYTIADFETIDSKPTKNDIATLKEKY